jgi:hypothetical protein
MPTRRDALACALGLALTLGPLACGGGGGHPGPDPTTDFTPYPTGGLACAGKAKAGIADHLLVGYAGDLPATSYADLDIHYQYIAGVLAPDPACLDAGRAKAAGCGTAWWGTWQWDQVPPGQFVRDFVSGWTSAGLTPMLTYYVILPAAQQRLGIVEGTPEVTTAATSATFMTAYLADFRFLLKQVGTARVIIHVEPDFWGYAQHAARAASTDAHGLPAAVATANPTDCAGVENSIAGLGQCLVKMARSYAPNALVSLHGSAWASGFDCVSNTDPRLDVAAEAVKTADFLAACGAGADLVVVDISDRDAGWYQRQSPPRDSWLDAHDAVLPTFAQAFAWSRALSDRLGKPALWWQVPLGNAYVANSCDANGVGAYQDNKLDYFFDHPERVAASGAIGVAFGAGAACQTTPSTDRGRLQSRARALAAAGGQPLCP